MSTEYMKATTGAQREALARKIAQLRLDGVPWDGPGGIVAMRLVSSATVGRALLRKYKLNADSGGPVEILESYDRFEINPKTGRRKGYSENTAPQAARRTRSDRSPPASAKSPVATRHELPVAASTGDACHAPIRPLVRRIRHEMNAAVPDVDPRGPGVDAKVLIVLRDPGRLGALRTNYLSAFNPDRTAGNQRRLLAAAKLPAEVCLFWNAVPWDLEGRNPSSSDLDAGARYLTQLVGLMSEPPILVACGNAAHKVCARARLEAVEVCHPSDRGLRGGGVDREPAHLAGLKKAARSAEARGKNRRRHRTVTEGSDRPAPSGKLTRRGA